jgi:hypothetical protein
MSIKGKRGNSKLKQLEDIKIKNKEATDGETEGVPKGKGEEGKKELKSKVVVTWWLSWVRVLRMSTPLMVTAPSFPPHRIRCPLSEVPTSGLPLMHPGGRSEPRAARIRTPITNNRPKAIPQRGLLLLLLLLHKRRSQPCFNILWVHRLCST